MGKFLLDIRKYFLIMSNFYLVEILSEPSSLTIETSKKYSKWAIMCSFWVFFFFIMRIRNSHCKVLQECSSWTSRNGLVQMFFPTPNRNMFTEKRVKLERLLAILREHVTYNVKWVEVHKVHEAFWAKLYCKTRDLFH